MTAVTFEQAYEALFAAVRRGDHVAAQRWLDRLDALEDQADKDEA